MNIAATHDAVLYLLAFLVPLGGTLLLTPLAARAAHRFDVLDRPGGHKNHPNATPYLGGVGVGMGLLLIGGIAAGANGQLFTILAGGLVLGALGLIDDVRTVPPAVRLFVEAAAGLSLWFVGVRAGVLQTAWIDLPLTIVWVVAVVNALNFVDNMDGLAAGVTTAASSGIGVIAAAEGDYLVAAFAFAVAGASVGFLRYNLPPARIFLGDAGSMLLGFLVAALTLKLDLQVELTAARLLTIVLLAAVPLFDLSLVVVARLTGRRTVWVGGTDHTSHRLAHRGHSGTRVTLTFAAAQVICSVAAVSVYRASPTAVYAVASLLAAAWVVLIAVLLRLSHPIPPPSTVPNGSAEERARAHPG